MRSVFGFTVKISSFFSLAEPFQLTLDLYFPALSMGSL